MQNKDSSDSDDDINEKWETLKAMIDKKVKKAQSYSETVKQKLTSKEQQVQHKCEEMFKQIEKERKQLDHDKAMWKKEQEEVSQKIANQDQIIELNVGGVTKGFTVRRSVLCQVPGSALEAMFSGRHQLAKIDGKVFVDRNPDTFIHVVDYLRNGMQMP